DVRQDRRYDDACQNPEFAGTMHHGDFAVDRLHASDTDQSRCEDRKKSAEKNKKRETGQSREENDSQRNPGDGRDEAKGLEDCTGARINIRVKPHQKAEGNSGHDTETEAHQYALYARPAMGPQRMAERVAVGGKPDERIYHL